MRTLLRDKKGQTGSSGEDDGQTYVVSSKIYYFAVVLILIVLAFVAFVLISKGYVSSLVAVPKVLVHDSVIARITNVCFVGEQSVQDNLQNVIDLKEFTDENLEKCFEGKGAPRIVLRLKSADNSFDYTEIFSSKGGLDEVDERYILVRIQDGSLHPGILTIEQPK